MYRQISWPLTLLLTSLQSILSRRLMNQLNLATQSLTPSTQMSLRSPRRNIPSCGAPNNTETPNIATSLTRPQIEAHRTTSTKISPRNWERPNITWEWRTSPSTRTLSTVAESSPTQNSQVAEYSASSASKAQANWYVPEKWQQKKS